MHTYIWRGKYSIDAFAGMLSSPVHRMEAAKKLIEDNGFSIEDVYWQPQWKDTVCYISAKKLLTKF